MRKSFLALCATAIAAPATAQVDTSISIEDAFAGQTFENRGQCQSALARERNERRQTGTVGDNSTYNENVRRDYVCEQNEDGDYVINDVADGD